jgi:non-homologous end joining protein Ku
MSGGRLSASRRRLSKSRTICDRLPSMKPYRNVNLTFGLMTLPVSIAAYTGGTSDPRPKVVGKKGEAVKQVYVDEAGKQVSKDVTKRSFNGKVVTQDELEQINAACKISDLEILEVCPLAKVDKLRTQKSYYIFSNKSTGNPEVFATFVKALGKTKTAVVKWTPSTRQELLALQVVDGNLIGTALAFAGDVKEADSDVTAHQAVKVGKKELELATQLIEAYEGDGSTLDTAQDDAIQLKQDLISGKTSAPEITGEENQAKAKSFLADLEASKAALEAKKS